MTRFPRFQPVFGVLCLALGLSLSLGLIQGCARSGPLHRRNTVSSASEQTLPFHPDTDQASGSEGTHPAVSPDPNATSAIPFRTALPHMLPAGTLLTVQLEDALSTAKAHAGDPFAASVASSMGIDGNSLIERGALATGHIESVRTDARSGYFQLTLTAITVEGRQLALQTSSLFARGTAEPSDDIRVQKGRHLTFRLTSPVLLDEPKSVANRQSLSPGIE